MLGWIAKGAYELQACQAAGVGRRTLQEWKARGELGEEPYASFFESLLEARAKARVRAETAVAREDPKAWLMHGPGRERPGEPGWGRAVLPGGLQVAEGVEGVLERALRELGEGGAGAAAEAGGEVER